MLGYIEAAHQDGLYFVGVENIWVLQETDLTLYGRPN
jgi:hypothetical protein